MDEKILVGTSGWSYEDWIGVFYPENLDKSKFLTYYSRYFKTVEINFTYYRMPNRYILKAISRNVPSNFVFTIKLFSSFTHQTTLPESYEVVPERDRDEFLIAIEPMKNKGMLDTLLAQFPQSFHFSQKNLDYILKLKRAFKDYNLAIEFRHKSWYNNLVYEVFERENLCFVSVDEPDIPSLPPRDFIITNKVGYVRLHSRDKSKWYQGEKLRYDYLYSKEELLEWVEKIRNKNFEKLYVYFNNCHNGQAVENAKQFLELLTQIEH